MPTTHHELLECKHATILPLRKKSQVDKVILRFATQCKNKYVYSQDSAYVTFLFKFAIIKSKFKLKGGVTYLAIV